ncbi:MAG: dipeptidase PepV [Anaerovoracaceae bacterium]|jgi:succinyl-diaminopimelate desuccinylase|nr:dipeptidase PepV [Anaerovoracaceae bacterium]
MTRVLSKDIITEELEKNKDALLEDLSQLLKIKSLRGDALEYQGQILPFGKGVHEALLFMKKIAQREGFIFYNVDHYGAHIDFGEGKEETMGVLLHLDVVPEGSSWKYEAFGGQIEGGKIYGRGALDDKGPTIAVFYALKILKDLGHQPAKGIRLILGLDEETGWSGMDYYLARESPPDFGFTPDAEFPVIRGEKGILTFDIVKKLSKTLGIERGLELRSLKGGQAPNMVADSARALVFHKDPKHYEMLEEKIEEYNYKKDYKVKSRLCGKSMEITTSGVSAHGARPERGVNAISIIMDFLSTLIFSEDDVNDFIEFYKKHIAFDLGGKLLGVDFSDKESGSLILNIGKANINSKEARVTVNIRYPVTLEEDVFYETLMAALSPYDMGIVKRMIQKPIYFAEDNPLIQQLMSIYKDYTGDQTSKAAIIGGGTYARSMNNFVAFGPSFPGDEEVAHQKDEYMDIDKLMLAAAIYAQAIYELTK